MIKFWVAFGWFVTIINPVAMILNLSVGNWWVAGTLALFEVGNIYFLKQNIQAMREAKNGNRL